MVRLANYSYGFPQVIGRIVRSYRIEEYGKQLMRVRMNPSWTAQVARARRGMGDIGTPLHPAIGSVMRIGQLIQPLSHDCLLHAVLPLAFFSPV